MSRYRACAHIGSTLGRDVRHAIRSIGHARTDTLLSLAMLAVGIGGATAAIAITDAALVRPVPFHDPDALVSITIDSTIDGRPYEADPSLQQMSAWAAHAGVFEDIAAVRPTP